MEAEVEKYKKQFNNTGKGIDNFLMKQRRMNAAITATRGPIEGAAAEHRALQRRIEQLIKGGIDPLDPRLKSIKKRYQELNGQVKKSGGILSGQIGTYIKATASIAGATMALRKLATEAKEWSNAARDAEEIASKYFTVFRNMAPQAVDAVRQLSDNFDLADSTAQKLLGDTGDILTGFGFTQEAALDLAGQVNSLAIDLASFTNFEGGAEGASKALTKALLGEAESAKALGIVIRQDTAEYKGLVKQKMEDEGVTLLQAKALAALEISTKQSKNAIGDYERTSESFANAQRRAEESSKMLKEQLGGLVNEGLRPFVSWTATATRELANFIKGQRIAKVAEELETLQIRLKAIEKGTVASRRKGGILGFHVSDAKDSEKAASDLTKQISELETKLKELKGESTADAIKPIATEDTIANPVETAKTQAEKMAELRLAEYNSEVEYQNRITENLIEQGEARMSAELAAEQELAEKKLAIRQYYVDTVKGMESSLFGILDQITANKLAAIENEYAKREELINANISDEEEREKALEDLAKEQAMAEYEVQLAQFKNKKIQGIASTAMNTAEAIMKAYATLGPIAGHIAAGVIGGLGATQASLIASQQPPAPPTAQTGTMPSGITVPDTNRGNGDRVAVVAQPGENVSVAPRGSSGKMMQVLFQIGDDVLVNKMQEIINDGLVVITDKNIGRSRV